jgi:hypothetical protein
MNSSAIPERQLAPDQACPTRPNSSFAANFTPTAPSLESLRNFRPSITGTHRTEEMEEKIKVNKIPKSTNFSI